MTEETTTEIQDEIEEVLNEETTPVVEEKTEEVTEETPEKKDPPKAKKQTFDERQKEIKANTYKFRESERRAKAAEEKLRLREEAFQKKYLKRENFETDEQHAQAKKEFSPQPQNTGKTEEQVIAEYKARKHHEKNTLDWEVQRADAIENDPKFVDKEAFVTDTIEYYENNGSKGLLNCILESNSKAALVSHLGENPEETERIAQLSPMSAAREIGKIEASLSKKGKTKPQISRAPSPVSKVKGSAAPKGLEKMSYKELAAQRNKEEFGR